MFLLKVVVLSFLDVNVDDGTLLCKLFFVKDVRSNVFY